MLDATVRAPIPTEGLGEPNLDETRAFLTALDPNVAQFTFATFDDVVLPNGKKRGRGDLLNNCLDETLDELAPRLAELNAQGAGVFVMINAGDGKGRSDKHVSRVRAVWQDDDQGWQGRFPLLPSIEVQTSSGKHQRCWLTNGLSNKAHATVMDRLVASYGHDKNAKGLCRVLRLPGFYHRKGKPVLVRLTSCSGTRYSHLEILKAFPPVERTKTPARSYPQNESADFEEVREALRFIPTDDRAVWLEIGMSIKAHFGDVGRPLWDEWAVRSNKFDSRDQDKVWRSFKRDGIGIGTLYLRAKESGWQPTVSNISNFSGGRSQVSKNAELKPEPIPLIRQHPKGETYPVEALGSLLGDATMAFHEATQAPIPLCANAVLSVATLAVQPHIDIELPTGTAVPVSELFVSIAPSGERKTATDKKALKPVRLHGASLWQRYEDQQESYRIDRSAWEAQEKKILADRKLDLSEQKLQLRALGPAPKPPLKPILTVSEPTTEGAAKLLMNDYPTIGIFASEGGQFVGGHGMADDAKLRTAGFYSRLWDDGTLERVRSKEGAKVCSGRRLSMHLQVQPGVAAKFFSDPILMDQGLLSRILAVFPESAMGTRKWKDPSPEHEAAIVRYCARIQEIFSKPLPLSESDFLGLEPKPLPMSREAHRLWIRLADHIESQLGPNGAMELISGIANKLPEHAARIAAVVEFVENENPEMIGEQRFKDAMMIAQYYAGETYRIYEMTRADAGLMEAQRLLDWINEKWPLIASSSGRDANTISLVDIYQSGPNQMRSAKVARKFIKILAEHEHLIEKPDGLVIKDKDGKERLRKEAWHIVGRVQ
ncbi:hypothetical protein MnTg02_01353 [bacterium MnTg02]|nr:hypothetical protein MnTg02_01353 [bacterium MnTg02]